MKKPKKSKLTRKVSVMLEQTTVDFWTKVAKQADVSFNTAVRVAIAAYCLKNLSDETSNNRK